MPGFAGRAVIKPFIFGPAGVNNPMAWFKADSINQADQSRVVQWKDLSGNGYHIGNGETLKQPVLKTNVQNGQSCVRFDGTDDFLTSITVPSAGSDNWTMFVVGLSTVSGTCVPVHVGLGSSNGWGLALSSSTETTKIGVLRGGSGWNNSIGIGANFSSVRILSGVRKNGVFRLWKSGGAVALSTSAYMNAPTTYISAGGHDPATANLQPLDIYEIIIYDRALTDVEIDAIGNYLKDRYAAPYSNVVHPYGVPDVMAWFDASDTSSIVDSAGNVSSWKDLMGVRHLGQGTTAAQPRTNYESINGLNAIRFGGDDYMAHSGWTGVIASDATMFVVCLEYSERANSGLIIAYNSVDVSDFGGPNSFYLDSGGSGYYLEAVRNYAAPNGKALYPGSGLMPLAVWQGRFNNSGLIEIWKNQIQGTNNTRAGSWGHAASGYIVGGRYMSSAVSTSYRFLGLICEILVFNRALANFERDQIRNSLYSKWGISP